MKRLAIALTIIVVGAVAWLVVKKLRSAQEFKSQEITVYAYSSFVSSWGPGPEIAKEFETLYGATVKLIDAGDSRLIPQKIKLEGENFAADVVLGLDQFSLPEASTLKWKKIEIGKIKFHPHFPKQHFKSDYFVPFDWSPMTFIYRKGEIDPPKSLEDLKKNQYAKTLSVIDPRTSTPGYQFLNWIVRLYGPDKAGNFLKDIQETILLVSPGWSAAYGLFAKKQAKLVFSYETSAVYHWKEENNYDYQPAILNEPHPFQVEFAAISEQCHNCAAAKEFLRFLLSKYAQTKIMNTNYMLPIIDDLVKGTEFEKLPVLKLQIPELDEDNHTNRNLRIWKDLGA